MDLVGDFVLADFLMVLGPHELGTSAVIGKEHSKSSFWTWSGFGGGETAQLGAEQVVDSLAFDLAGTGTEGGGVAGGANHGIGAVAHSAF